LLIGTLDKSGVSSHRIPNQVVPAGKDVYKVETEEIRQFHADSNSQVQLSYYSQVIAHAGLFAIPLLEAIIEKLESFESSNQDIKSLTVLRQTLAWQRTIGGMRL